MLGEFFAARADELDDPLVEEGPFERFETVEAKSVDPVSVSTLGEILGAGTYDDLIERAAGEGREGADGEAGVFWIPVEIRDALAECADSDAVAAEWGRTDELSGWEPEDTELVVRELVSLARGARDSDRQLWFWWSL
jgi:hypothetical protein